MYGLTADDLELQAPRPRLRRRADPARGRGRGARRRAARRASAEQHQPSGPSSSACTPPTSRVELGGRGLHDAAAGAGAGAGRPGHQRAGLVPGHSPGLVARRSPTTTSASAGCCRPCAARCRSATRSPRSTPAPTSPTWRRPPAATATSTCSNGVKWHVTSFNEADLRVLPGRADRRRRTPASRRCSSSTCRHPGRPRRPHAGVHPHHRAPPPDRRVRGRAGAGHATWSGRRATACPSSTSGSGSSG